MHDNGTAADPAGLALAHSMRNLFGHETGAGSGPGQRLIGAALVGPKDQSELVSIDEHGEIWKLAPRHGSVDRRTLVRHCIDRGLLVFTSIGDLAQALHHGRCLGLVSQVANTVAQRWRT